jgi:hypothetical protein
LQENEKKTLDTHLKNAEVQKYQFGKEEEMQTENEPDVIFLFLIADS